MDGLNGFAFLQHMTELSSMKVQTLTLGRPVGYQGQQKDNFDKLQTVLAKAGTTDPHSVKVHLHVCFCRCARP